MNTGRTPQSTAKIAGRPIHPMTVALPITLLVITFVCDALYTFTGETLLATVALYALGAGIVFAALAGVFGFIDYFGSREIRSLRAAHIHMIGNTVILLLSIVNFLLRYGAAEPVPTSGLILSTIVFVAIHVTGWMGWTMVYRHGVGVNTARMHG
ncbi:MULTISPECIES: DUF2231 domain-containing protein [unclassified Sphingomonas]|uniref:DUF2231 domain-containing protein n=1 Tax=unclassified Sphingomonas TaxID=196159 RepID=UPI0002FF5361|nr:MULTISPECIES: DUF2231 domain-containing protein [unclassified Sphingomonas]KTF67821.1 hypothetical protein ATB93_16695 [Sphingomonas sp. WG]